MNRAVAESESAWLSDYRDTQSTLPGQNLPWLARMRADALERFAELGLPTTRNEDWKFTDVKAIAKRHFTPARAGVPVDVDALSPYLLGDQASSRLVFVDGHFSVELSATEREDGVYVGSLAAALEERPAELEPHLGRYADSGAHGFAALNTAFLRDGACIHVPRGVVVEKPIQLVFLGSGSEDTAVYLRNLIVAEESAQAVVVETYASLADGRYLTNAMTEVFVGDNASVEHYKLKRESEQAYHVAGIHVHQGRDSRYTSHNLSAGARLMRNEITAILDDEGIECTLNGLYLCHGRQHVDNHTRVEHRKPHSTSREWYKGVLDEHSRGVFTGRVVVAEHAQKTDASQANNNLVLSEGAEADSRPQLEIYADDVKCSHGSTVGQLDEEAMFYLRSRGIDYELARSLMVYAFVGDILQQMKLEPVRAQLESELTGKLLHGRSTEDLR